MQRIFREERTLSDLRIIEPGGDLHFNVLDYERSKGADTREITQGLMTFGETLDRIDGAGNEHDPFWKNQNRREMHNGVEIVTGATGKIDPWDLQRFISGAAVDFAETGNEEWRKKPHFRMLVEAEKNANTAIRKHDFELAGEYWMKELPAMNDRTRSSISAGLWDCSTS